MEKMNLQEIEVGLRKVAGSDKMYDYLTKELKISPEKATELENTFHEVRANPYSLNTLSPDDKTKPDSLSLAITYIAEDIIMLRENTQTNIQSVREELDT